MITIYFFYGLAFVVLGITILTVPKRHDILNLHDNLWPLGLFGLIHGINEWIDLFIFRGTPFNPEYLKFIGWLILPISFIFLIIFPIRVFLSYKPGFRWARFLWILPLSFWFFAFILTRDFNTAGIFARYFICIPGAFLTAGSLYFALLKADKEKIPSFVSLLVTIAAGTFFAYGIFSGLVVPKADFPPASLINYQNFLRMFGLPVQLFRMACAIIVSICFFWITGVFYYEKGSAVFAGGIRRKMRIVLFTVVSTYLLIAAVSVYVIGKRILYDINGRDYHEIAESLAISTSEGINEETEDLNAIVNSPLWRDIIKEGNLRYQDMKDKDVRKYLAGLDRKWVAARPDSLLVKKYLNIALGKRLRQLTIDDKDIAEIFVTDAKGGLITASGKTTDFYQADEDWWIYAFNGGKGRDYLGDVEYDESSGVYAIVFAAPIRDEEKNVIGVCKAVMDAELLLDLLSNFKSGKTGHAILVNRNADIVFGRGLVPGSIKYCCPSEFNRLLKNNIGFGTIFENISDKINFTAWAKINNVLLLERNIDWFVLMIKDQKEFLTPVRGLLFWIIIVFVILLAFLFPVSSILSRVFTRPIIKFYEAITKIKKGDRDYQFRIDSRDEVEQLSIVFKELISETNVLMRNIKELNEELRGRTEDLEAANMELMELDSMKDDFVSTVSHEIRTPIGIIKEGVRIMLNKMVGDVNDKQRELLTVISGHMDRLTNIVNKLLDISKLESGMVDLDKKSIDVNKLMDEVFAQFEPVMKEKGVKFNINAAKSNMFIYADKDRMIQTFINLLHNALRFTHKGSVEVSAEQKGDEVQFTVTDTGIGIQEKDMPKLFNKFQQFGRAQGPGEKGTGLGLAIVKNLVELHDGKIWAESTAGKGTKIYFTIPTKANI